jgi:hypothetical protein
MERQLDRSIAIAPLANVIVWKASLALWVRGDLAETKSLMDRVPARTGTSERVVLGRWEYAMAAGEPSEGRLALQRLTSQWVEDYQYIGPKALLAAQLLEFEGKRELARLQHEAALAEIRRRQAKTPANTALKASEAWCLHGLGRDAEARQAYRAALETVRRPIRFRHMSAWWFSPIPTCLSIGERATALELIREATAPGATPPGARDRDGSMGELVDSTAAEARAALAMRFKLDPRMAPFRADPEIAALLAGSTGRE